MAMPGTPPFSSSVPLTYTFLSIKGVSLAFGFLWPAAIAIHTLPFASTMARRMPFLGLSSRMVGTCTPFPKPALRSPGSPLSWQTYHSQ